MNPENVGAQFIAPVESASGTTIMGYNTDEGRANAQIPCPYCGSTDTELFSLFGQQLLTVQYYCNSCHTPFERVKDDDVLDDYAARRTHERKEGQP